jgi:hypothetical protein
MNIFSAFFARFSPFAGPASAGTNGQVLTTDGAGNTSWSDAGTTTDASLLTEGTLADARLSANVATKTYADAAVTTHAAVTNGVHGISAFGAGLVDDADAAAARATLVAPGTGVANTFTAQQTFETGAAGASPALFTQTGGDATKRVEIGHNGSGGLITNKASELWISTPGNLRLYSSLGASVIVRRSDDLANLFEVNGQGIVSVKAFSQLTPAQITADRNDYNPGQATYFRLSSDASRTITGWGNSQIDGMFVASIVNVGSNDIVFAHQSLSSSAANRFICKGAADITLAANEEAAMWYDNTTQRWRIRKL